MEAVTPTADPQLPQPGVSELSGVDVSIQVCFLGVPHSHSSVLNNYYEIPWLLSRAKSMGMKIEKGNKEIGEET